MTKILIVDDEISFCRQARAFLSVDGYNIVTECDGLRVLSQLEQFKPDILIIDVDLGISDLDGRTLCAEISKMKAYAEGNIHIIMISGHYVDPVDEIAGFNVGADNYLLKPFEMSQLAARVKAIVRRKNMVSTPTELKIDKHLTINAANRTATMDGLPLKLSRLEFNVLNYLAQSPEVVMPKSELLEKVWSTPHVEVSAVAKCISILRGKLSSDCLDAYIQTVHGIGYRFSPKSHNDR